MWKPYEYDSTTQTHVPSDQTPSFSARQVACGGSGQLLCAVCRVWVDMSSIVGRANPLMGSGIIRFPRVCPGVDPSAVFQVAAPE